MSINGRTMICMILLLCIVDTRYVLDFSSPCVTRRIIPHSTRTRKLLPSCNGEFQINSTKVVKETKQFKRKTVNVVQQGVLHIHIHNLTYWEASTSDGSPFIIVKS